MSHKPASNIKIVGSLKTSPPAPAPAPKPAHLGDAPAEPLEAFYRLADIARANAWDKVARKKAAAHKAQATQ